MEVEPEQYENLTKKLDEILDSTLSSQRKNELIDEFEELLIDEVTELVVDSRPPRLYVFGRSGSGKSSLINALANRAVADVGAVEPTTVESDVYELSFSGQNIDWEIIDSRGLFESIPADGNLPIETVDELKSDLVQHNPDLLLHVMTPGQVRAGKADFEVVQQLDNSISGGLPPRIVCLNKVDTYLSPGDDWPPEQNPTLAQHILEALELVADILSIPDLHPFIEKSPFRGLIFDSAEIVGAIPTYAKEDPYWNLTTLVELLCGYLPNETLLHFARDRRRERLRRQLARKQTDAIAAAVSQLPRKVLVNPNSPVVSSYRRYIIALVGSFSGAELSVETVDEYLEAISSLDETDSILAELLDRVADITLSLLGTPMENLRAQTYGIGRSAEAYFFDDELIAPSEFRDDARGQRVVNHINNL